MVLRGLWARVERIACRGEEPRLIDKWCERCAWVWVAWWVTSVGKWRAMARVLRTMQATMKPSKALVCSRWNSQTRTRISSAPAVGLQRWSHDTGGCSTVGGANLSMSL